MTEFLQLTAIASLWIWGVFAAFDEGHIFWGIRKVVEATLGTTACKPIICCPICMASLHGGAIGFFYYGLQWEVIALIFCVCGLNFIIKTIIYG